MPDHDGVGRGPLVAGAGLLAVLLAAGGVYTASASTSTATAADYRTALVSRGPVSQVLTLTGTAERVDQVTAAFPANGTVTGIEVMVGDHVSAGQSLASIDATALRANLLAAQATLAQDQASLIADQTASTSTASAASTSSGSASGAGTGSGTGSGSTGAAGSATSTGTTSHTASTQAAVHTTSGHTASGTGAASGTSGATGRTSPTGSPSQTGTGRSGGSGPTTGSHPGAGGSTLPALSTRSLERSLARTQQALLAEERACAPVLGTSSSVGGGHTRPQTGTPTPTGPAWGTGSSGRVNPAAFTRASTPSPTPSDTATAAPTTGTPSPTSPGSPTGAPTGTPTGTPTSTPSPTTPPPGGTGAPSPTIDQLRSCAGALASVSTAQHAAEAAMSTLASQIAHELSVVMRAVTGPTSGPASTSPPSVSPSSSRSPAAAGSTGHSASGNGSGTAAHTAGTPATGSASARRTTSSSGSGGSGGAGVGTGGGSSSPAARIASDEVAILQDQAAVTQARSDLAGTTLKAPISGTVGRVDLRVGQSSTASTGIVIVGAGAADVTVQVPLADMGLVHSGLGAGVTPAGDVDAVPGTVDSVTLLPTSSNAATPSYPATIVVPRPTRSMASGSVVSVAITVGQASDAVRVPVSALSGVQAGTAVVQVLAGTGTKAQAVTVGAVGGGFAQVLTGLQPGDRVVLADVTAALPSNQTTGLRGLGGGGFANRGGGSTGGAGRAATGGGSTGG